VVRTGLNTPGFDRLALPPRLSGQSSNGHRAVRDAEAGVSTGLAPLDRVLGGLNWGDNVVWQTDGASAEPFYAAVLQSAEAFDACRWVGVGGAAVAQHPRLQRVGASRVAPADLLAELVRRCAPGKRNLLLFESLDSMVHAWGADQAGAFLVRCCSLLLDVGAIAYWSLDLRRAPAAVRETVEAVSQCVLRVDRHSVYVTKADGREEGARGALLHWDGASESPVLSEADVGERVAASLRALRRSRHFSQHQLAELAGVTSSAISQAERAERGLSLSTLVRLSGNLGLTLDDLVDGDEPAPYRIGRRRGDPRRAPGAAGTLLGGLGSDVRIDLVQLAAREHGAPPARQDGDAIVAVSHGLVQIQLGDHTPAIRDGEVLVADCALIDGWRNLGDREAAFFWIVRAGAIA
jgi:transcriptional regulator with XRE-family HTH domain